MKKLINSIALLLVLAMLVVVVLAVAAGTEKGAVKISEMLYSVTSGKVALTPEEIGKWGIRLEGGFYSLEEDDSFDASHEVYSGDFQRVEIPYGAERMSVEVGGCALHFVPSGDGTFYAEGNNVGKFQAFVKDSVLYVKMSGAMMDPEDYPDNKAVFYIPEDYLFGQVDADVGVGVLKMQGVQANQMNLEVGAGQIEVWETQAATCALDVGMGQLLFAGDISETINAECSMGNLELTLTGKETDYNYAVKGAMGSVTIGEEEYGGKTQDEMIQNGAEKNCNIQCAVGNVKVSFSNVTNTEDANE